MKKILAILILTLTTTVSFAQDRSEDYKSKAKSELDHVKKSTVLTKDQEAKLLKVYYKMQETYGNKQIEKSVKDALIKELKEKEAKILAEKSK